MQLHIETDDELERERVIRLLCYSLKARREDIETMRLSLTPAHDRLGARLLRCVTHTVLRDGQIIELEELQSTVDLAVTRNLERCARTIQRRLYRPGQRMAM